MLWSDGCPRLGILGCGPSWSFSWPWSQSRSCSLAQRANNGGYTVKIPALKHWLYMLIPQVMKNGHRFHREKHFLLAGIWSMSILRKPRLESFESVYVWVPRAGITLFLFPDSFFALHIPSYGRKNEWSSTTAYWSRISGVVFGIGGWSDWFVATGNPPVTCV